jgi:hypothetical protein
LIYIENAMVGQKIIDVLKKKIEAGETFYSFEYFPPKTDEGVQNLYERQLRMVKLGPAFCDITWGAGGSTADLTLDIATRMQKEVGMECMMHLTCTNMPMQKLEVALDKVSISSIYTLHKALSLSPNRLPPTNQLIHLSLPTIPKTKQTKNRQKNVELETYLPLEETLLKAKKHLPKWKEDLPALLTSSVSSEPAMATILASASPATQKLTQTPL